MTRPLLPDTRIGPLAQVKLGRLHPSIVDEVDAAVSSHPVVVVGMAWNPHVGRARKALTDAGIDHVYVGYGNYLTGWKKRLAIKLWTGWPTFPQVFVNGSLIGGANETQKALGDGSVQAALA